MNSKTKKNVNKYTESQRKTLITCAVIMVVYIVLAYFVTLGSFWTFTAIHTVLAAIAIFFIWLGGAPKTIIYLALFLSLAGAGTALALILYYLTILGSLANG